MILRGVQNGDVSFRHFTFDDEEVIEQGGKYYYKVKYKKSELENSVYAEDEFEFIECSKVKVLGGKKAKPLPTQEKAQVVESQPKEKPKTTKSTKSNSKKTKESQTNQPTNDYDGSGFEYYVEECFADDVNELKASLNKIGQDGWEMCGFDTNKNLFGKIHIIAIFKRRC